MMVIERGDIESDDVCRATVPLVASAVGAPDFTILKTGLEDNPERQPDHPRRRLMMVDAFYCKIALASRLVTSDPLGASWSRPETSGSNHMIAPWTGCDCAKRLGAPTTVQAA
ncbi:MAG TPA: hypothetical protein VJ757_14380 [Pseudonocardiaceae bacterium]|nr:hypothetical protein [Pseudonocardiaceae bacterium]